MSSNNKDLHHTCLKLSLMIKLAFKTLHLIILTNVDRAKFFLNVWTRCYHAIFLNTNLFIHSKTSHITRSYVYLLLRFHLFLEVYQQSLMMLFLILNRSRVLSFVDLFEQFLISIQNSFSIFYIFFQLHRWVLSMNAIVRQICIQSKSWRRCEKFIQRSQALHRSI